MSRSFSSRVVAPRDLIELLQCERTVLAQRRCQLLCRGTGERLEEALDGLEVDAFQQLGAPEVVIADGLEMAERRRTWGQCARPFRATPAVRGRLIR